MRILQTFGYASNSCGCACPCAAVPATTVCLVHNCEGCCNNCVPDCCAGLPCEAGSSSSLQPAGGVQLRCMQISKDGRLLAAGDTAGNVHVYDVATLQLLVVQEAHDSEVLCLDFSPPAAQLPANSAGEDSSAVLSRGGKTGLGLAVSGSRDTLIHVYDAGNSFRLLETLDEHEAEVTAVRFTHSGRGLVSCGADHSIIFRCAGLRAHLMAGIWLHMSSLASQQGAADEHIVRSKHIVP